MRIGVALVIALAACGGPDAPRNRAGIALVPGAGGAEYERFLDGTTDSADWSVGLTAGIVWGGVEELIDPPPADSPLLVVANPFVRWHAWRPTSWLAVGADTKLSLVWVVPRGGEQPTRLVPALEAHLQSSAEHGWGYVLLGVGVKQFLTRTDAAGGVFPRSTTLMGSEFSAGLRF